MDFINLLPPTVNEMIFQHLSGKEIIGATLVHRDWNNFLSKESLTSWKNVWIKPKALPIEDLHHIVNSERRYRKSAEQCFNAN
jgi:hypothetical protein